MMNFLAEQLEKKNLELLLLVDEAKQKCEQLLFLDTTSKYFEIANMIRDLDQEKNKALIGDMVPFITELRKVVLNLNQKLLDLDLDISYFGVIFYDELT